jgi:hypothetical protein
LTQLRRQQSALELRRRLLRNVDLNVVAISCDNASTNRNSSTTSWNLAVQPTGSSDVIGGQMNVLRDWKLL